MKKIKKKRRGNMEEKVERILEALQDLPYYCWENIKREIDKSYETVQKNNVPNSQLGTLKENLKHWSCNLSKYKI